MLWHHALLHHVRCVLCALLLLQIRSLDYAQTKVKQPSSKAIYRLVAMDMFAADTKASHISRVFQLPQTGAARFCIWTPAWLA